MPMYRKSLLILVLLFVGVLAAISAGIFPGSRWAVPMVPLLACFFFLLACTLALLWRNHGKTWIAVLLLCFVAGILRFVMTYALPENDISHFAGSQGTVEGIVTEEPRVTETAEGFKKLRYTIFVRKVKEKEGERPA